MIVDTSLSEMHFVPVGLLPRAGASLDSSNLSRVRSSQYSSALNY